MKLVNSLILFSFYFIYIVNSFGYQCHKQGDECQISISDRCEKGYTCQTNPDTSIGVDDPNYKPLICLPELKFGDKCDQQLSCSRDLDCISPTGYSEEINQRFCLDNYFAVTGEKCEFNFHCKSGPCVNSTCTQIYGETDIQYGLGEFCEKDSQCISGLVCYNEQSICIEKYSLDIGQFCESSYQCDIAKSLVCIGDDENGFSKCELFKPSTTNNCDNNYCGLNEFCNLKTNKCEPTISINQQCKHSELARDHCYHVNNCSGELNLSKRSCQIINCQVETNNYIRDCDNISNLCL